jgi:hypothetical protein
MSALDDYGVLDFLTRCKDEAWLALDPAEPDDPNLFELQAAYESALADLLDYEQRTGDIQ